jgi:hypothetical protein
MVRMLPNANVLPPVVDDDNDDNEDGCGGDGRDHGKFIPLLPPEVEVLPFIPLLLVFTTGPPTA